MRLIRMVKGDIGWVVVRNKEERCWVWWEIWEERVWVWDIVVRRNLRDGGGLMVERWEERCWRKKAWIWVGVVR